MRSTKRKEKIDLLKRIRGYVNPPPFLNAIYHSPVESLRIQADMIEAKERDMSLFDELIKDLEKDPTNEN